MTVPYSPPPPPVSRKKNTVWWLLGGVITLVLLLIAAAAIFFVVQRDTPSGVLSDEEPTSEISEVIQLDETLCAKIDWSPLAEFYPSDDESWIDEISDGEGNASINNEGFGRQTCDADIEPRSAEIDSVAFMLELEAHDDSEQAVSRHDSRLDLTNDYLREEIETSEIDIVDECDEAGLRTELDPDELPLRDVIAGCRVGNLNVFVISDNYLANPDSDVAPDEAVNEVAAPLTSEVLRALTG